MESEKVILNKKKDEIITRFIKFVESLEKPLQRGKCYEEKGKK